MCAVCSLRRQGLPYTQSRTSAAMIAAATAWNIAGDAYGWYTAEQARQCNTGCVRHTGSGYSEERVITAVSKLQDTVRLDLDRQLGQTHPGGRTVFEAPSGVFEMSTAAEVLRLTRNVRITGEGHASTARLAQNELAFRGAATQLSGSGRMNIEGVELDNCGKQTHMGKCCLHFHLSGNCNDCTFSHNSVHHTFQRGITVHGTHYSTVEDNAIYDARGANIYMEDGNEWSNFISANAMVCVAWHHCKISPNTWSDANGLQQDYMEQGGIWGISPSNVYLGNRMSLHENGFFIDSKNPLQMARALREIESVPITSRSSRFAEMCSTATPASGFT